MRIAFVQTYPIYHDFWSTEQWLALENRDKWMPAAVAGSGHDVELWAVGRDPGTHMVSLRSGSPLQIRLFEPSAAGKKTKFHESRAMADHCRAFRPDLCVLKGVDGGAGVRLIRKVLRPEGIPFAFVVGGKTYTRFVPEAVAVLYESDAQRRSLRNPRRPWRRSVPEDRLIRLPKIVDTAAFRPHVGIEKEWDILTVGRLVPRIKSYDALGSLATRWSVAVAGSGPALDALRSRFPQIRWLGKMAYDEMPLVMSRARVLFHTSRREYFPRVLAEAASCGLPAVAFEDAIDADVLPPECGLRVSRRGFVGQLQTLLSDPGRLASLAANSRRYADMNYGLSALELPVNRLLACLGRPS